MWFLWWGLAVKDKEKAKEDWTSLSLTIAVIVFVTVGYLTFIAFLSTKPENEALVDWFLKFMDKYGAFLAAIPVMIGVAVAKQQLDANRRQHVAQIKRSFRHELQTLKKLHSLSNSIVNYKKSRAYSYMSYGKTDAFPCLQPTIYYVGMWPNSLPYSLQTLVERTVAACDHAHAASKDPECSMPTMQANIKRAIWFANLLEKEVQHEMDDISQYWS